MMSKASNPLPASQPSKLSHIKPTGHETSDSVETLTAQASSLERALMDSLQPSLQNKQILTPTRYQTLLFEAHCNIAIQAQQQDELTKGAALLAQELELRRLLNMQCTLLIGV